MLDPDALHSFGGRHATAMFFPLGHPTTWRVIAMSGRTASPPPRDALSGEKPLTDELSLAELQGVVDGATGGGVRLRDPAWLAHF